MDTIEEVIHSVNSSTEETLTTDTSVNTNDENIALEEINSKAQVKQDNVTPEEPSDVNNIQQSETGDKSDLLTVENVGLSHTEEVLVTVANIEKSNVPIDSTINEEVVENNEIANEGKSFNGDENGQIENIDQADTAIECTETASNVTKQNSGNSTLIQIQNSDDIKDINLSSCLESSIKDAKYDKLHVKEEKPKDDNTSNTENLEDANLPCDTEKNEANSSKIGEIPEGNGRIINPEIILEGLELVQENIVQNTEKQPVNLEKENIDALIEQELSTVTHEKASEPTEIIPHATNNCVEEIVTQEATADHNNLNLVTEDSNNEEEITPHPVPDNEIEKQMSSIINQGESESCVETQGTISIAEAISRDFDETDSEEVDIRQENAEELKTVDMANDDVVVGVSLSDQLQHGTVTVTDTSGQIYYVQSVEDLIVVENDMTPSLDQPETIEVTVLSDMEQSTQKDVKPTRTKGKPSIPSHILGRNIDNPVIDTFRNGKVPPKPRLGVKIPYKNLTSQIVSKDEIAKEILDRQRQKYKQTGQTTREILFAKKITQRLAKKIAPSDTTISSIVVEKNKDEEAIDNSDLLAILEGDVEECELGSIPDPKMASTPKPTHGNPSENKISQNIKQSSSAKAESKKPMSKLTEREIALKQLQELPPGPRRRRYTSLSNKRNSEDTTSMLIENDVLSEKSASVERTSIGKTAPEDHTTITVTDATSSTKASNVAVASVAKLHHPTVEQPESVADEQLGSATITKSEVTNISKTTEPKSLPTKEVNKTEVAKTTLRDAKQSHPTTIVETIEKTKPLSTTSAKTSMVPIKIKTDVAKPPMSTTTDNKSKQDAPAKSVVAKIIDSTLPYGNLPHLTITAPLLTNTKEEFIERKQTGNPPIKTYTRKRKSIEDISIVSNVPDKKANLTHKDTNIPPNTYITKSSRIIKKKIIWDPDEPSTARSLTSKSPKIDPIKSDKPMKVEVSPSKIEKKPVTKLTVKIENKSPTRSPDSNRGKKRLTEIDKLLMDEGAINMLYAFKKVDEAAKKKKVAVISLDRVQRELINKSNEIKKDLKTNSDKVSPKSLRRKDSPVPTTSKKIVPALISRKKSKDSNRSSLHSPPASPSMLYPNNAEASRIIRRHSSSSYSSMEDFDIEKQVDLENQETTSIDLEKPNKKRIASTAENNKSKKLKRNANKENATTSVEAPSNDDSVNDSNKVESEEVHEVIYDKYKTFSVKEIGHMVQIILLPSFNNEAYLTPEILNELCSIMKELQDDNNCTIVVISSTASSFCHGINYKTLLNDKEQSRKTFAKKLATCVTNFLRTLATFPKILVAGVHGDTVGLGVTMLPLFDMVVASDTATFSIPNARLGCAAEGGSLLSLPHIMHNVLVSELLYTSRKLIAAEALRLGMVTRVLWPDKFQQELVSIVNPISNHSPQFMELTKKQLREHMTQHIDEVLSKEVDILTQHWSSSECQKNFGVYG